MHWLVTFDGKVQYRQSPEREADPCFCIVEAAGIVGTPMGDRRTHLVQDLEWMHKVSFCLPKARDPAHGYKNLRILIKTFTEHITFVG
jgi:hypothetical protein